MSEQKKSRLVVIITIILAVVLLGPYLYFGGTTLSSDDELEELSPNIREDTEVDQGSARGGDNLTDIEAILRRAPHGED